MLKRIVVGILGLTVLGAGGAAALYQSTQSASAAAPLQTTTNSVAAPQASVGDPWTAAGKITTLDTIGFTLSASDGTSYYVELGPASYWQAQGVTLAVGDSVTINGYAADGQYHAGTVTLGSGKTLTLRDQAGRPLWSGGAGNGAGNGQGNGGSGNSAGNGQGNGNAGNGAGNGQGNGSAGANGLKNGSGVPQPQAQVDEWITVQGTITAMNTNRITIRTTANETLTIQMGRPSFAQAQGITFKVGDEVSVVGFYQGTQFSAGEITQLSTGLRLMLRDPNGRPLWAGQGNNAQGQNGNGNGGNGQNGNGKGQGGQSRNGGVQVTPVP
jgi:hypothetical protein